MIRILVCVTAAIAAAALPILLAAWLAGFLTCLAIPDRRKHWRSPNSKDSRR